MTSAVLQAINGVSLAALLFLLASGFTLSFGLMRVVNMAHGAYYLIGGYIGLSIAEHTGSFALALAGGGAAVALIGFFVDRFLIRRTGENHLSQVLLTVGVAFVMGDVALQIWGGDNLMVPAPPYLKGAVVLPFNRREGEAGNTKTLSRRHVPPSGFPRVLKLFKFADDSAIIAHGHCPIRTITEWPTEANSCRHGG